MVSVYDGQIFLGQIYDRGAAGYECFDRDGILETELKGVRQSKRR